MWGHENHSSHWWMDVQQELPEKLFLYPTSSLQGTSGMIWEPKPQASRTIFDISGNMNNPNCDWQHPLEIPALTAKEVEHRQWNFWQLKIAFGIYILNYSADVSLFLHPHLVWGDVIKEPGKWERHLMTLLQPPPPAVEGCLSSILVKQSRAVPSPK